MYNTYVWQIVTEIIGGGGIKYKLTNLSLEKWLFRRGNLGVELCKILEVLVQGFFKGSEGLYLVQEVILGFRRVIFGSGVLLGFRRVPGSYRQISTSRIDCRGQIWYLVAILMVKTAQKSWFICILAGKPTKDCIKFKKKAWVLANDASLKHKKWWKRQNEKQRKKGGKERKLGTKRERGGKVIVSSQGIGIFHFSSPREGRGVAGGGRGRRVQAGCWGSGSDSCRRQACCRPCCNSHSCTASCTARARGSWTSLPRGSGDRTATWARVLNI